MDEHREEIQSKFFRSGPKTALGIKLCTESPSTCILHWSFTFMEMGMYHTIASKACVTMDKCENTEKMVFLINGAPHPTLETACTAVFEGHYLLFLTDLYQEMGVLQAQP